MTHEELLAHIDNYLIPTMQREPGPQNSAVRILKALRAVVGLHKNHGESWSVSGELRPTSNTCEECGIEFPYPCPTIQAIEKELG